MMKINPEVLLGGLIFVLTLPTTTVLGYGNDFNLTQVRVGPPVLAGNGIRVSHTDYNTRILNPGQGISGLTHDFNTRILNPGQGIRGLTHDFNTRIMGREVQDEECFDGYVSQRGK